MTQVMHGPIENLNWVATPDDMEEALTLPDGSTFILQLNPEVDHKTVFMKQGNALIPLSHITQVEGWSGTVTVEIDEYEEIEELI